MKKLSVLFVSVVVLGMLVAPAGAAGIITVTSVSNNGKTITVKGTAAITRAQAAASQPLRADAGDTVLVQVKRRATLIGNAYGGKAPYRYRWTSPAGSLIGADSPTAELDAAKAKVGVYVIGFTVTDAAGHKASDITKLIVIPSTDETKIFDEHKDDPTPGVTGTTVVIDFNVVGRWDTMDITVDWTQQVNDYDLTVIDPDGKESTGSGGQAGEPEIATIDKPKPGHWQLSLDKYATIGDTLHAVVLATPAPIPDPRPSVDAGGPYRFLIGAEQKLTPKITGGAKPLAIGWDLDNDGVFETKGANVTTHLAEGRSLVTVRAIDAKGLERRLMTSVLVARKARLHLDTSAITVIGIADTGVNPYHLEYSAETYPDPDVLSLTKNFTRHPSEYITGYPADARAIPITFGQGYLPKQDRPLWDHNKFIQPGKLHWIPGTKIIGGVATAKASADDPHPILDDNGHGSGSTTVSTGNRYGYCPTCLLVIVEGLNVGVKEAFPWVDISSNSFGPSLGLPSGLLSGADAASKAAVERGQTLLFAAGNGVANAFDVPQFDWGESYTGMPWNISVGALRRDNQRAIVGDGIPVHISAWGDGNLPSACRTGTVSHCSFGGTSAATPYTAGVFGIVLSQIRRAIGDPRAGQKAHQVVAEGVAIPGSAYLSDGKLTRAELREAVLKTAEPLNQGNDFPDFYPHSVVAPYVPFANVLFEGYGAATPEGARRAIDVLLGRTLLPDRSFEDLFFSIDDLVKTTLYGSYDSDGDGQENSVSRPAGFKATRAEVSTYVGSLKVLQRALRAQAAQDRNASARAAAAPQAQETFNVIAQPISKPLTLYLHRLFSDPEITPTDETPGLLPSVPPGIGIFIPDATTVRCNEHHNVLYMDSVDSKGDLDPCFNSRVTSTIANFRPVQSWASTQKLKAPLPAGSNVHVELFMAGETPSIVLPTGVLVATDREIGIGAASPGLTLPAGINGSLCDSLGDACWTKYDFSFDTTRPAFRGEELTFQIQLVGARSWAFGYEGNHASRLTITPAAMPATGLTFAVTILPRSGATAGQKALLGGTVTFPDLGSDPTGAGDHPSVRTVQVSVDDPLFTEPLDADVDFKSGLWQINLGSRFPAGSHMAYVRAAIDRTYPDVASTALDIGGTSLVQWQVTKVNGLPTPGAWHTASGFTNWSFTIPASTNGTIHVRVLSAGVEVGRTSVAAKAQSAPLPATGVGGDTVGLLLLIAAIFTVRWIRRGTPASATG